MATTGLASARYLFTIYKISAVVRCTEQHPNTPVHRTEPNTPVHRTAPEHTPRPLHWSISGLALPKQHLRSHGGGGRVFCGLAA